VARRIIIVSDLLPPKRGGLADHTHRLATELSHTHPVTVLTSPGASPSERFQVRPSIGDWQDLDWIVAELSEFANDSVLLWQYVPHMYGRGGVNLRLPRFWRDLRRSGNRQVFIAHEIMADMSWKPSRFWFALQHRRQWKALLASADAVAISTSRWLEDWSRLRPDAAPLFSLLPSPTSIEPQPVGPDHARAWRKEHGLDPEVRVLSYFGTLGPNKQFYWILDAWRAARAAGIPVALAVIGGAPDPNLPAELKALYRPLGYLPAPEVSAALHASDLLALPFSDGVSERRTTLMAGLAHGVAVATTVGHGTGTALAKAPYLGLCHARDERGFVQLIHSLLKDDARRHQLAADGRAASEREFSWPVIVRRLLPLLDPGASVRGPA
jgi:glycosyltransferase involved in cell wall biosynthesis